MRQRDDVEFPRLDARDTLLCPEGGAIDDFAPSVKILHDEVSEQGEARPERDEAEQVSPTILRGTGAQITPQHEEPEGRADEGGGGEGDEI